MISWSSGKDAAYALHEVRKAGSFEVVALLTTVVARTGRVVTHGIRGELLTRQAASVGLPLTRVMLPPSPSNVVYEKAMASALQGFLKRGVRHVIFGDLFLEDVRRYREGQLAALGMVGVFPLWGRETRRLAQDMIASGLEARLVAVDTRRLPGLWAGRAFDEGLLREVPPGVDPCGENGEFHTFVTAGPMMNDPVPVHVQAIRGRGGVATADLSLEGTPRPGRSGTHRARPAGAKNKSRGAPEGTGGSIG